MSEKDWCILLGAYSDVNVPTSEFLRNRHTADDLGPCRHLAERTLSRGVVDTPWFRDWSGSEKHHGSRTATDLMIGVVDVDVGIGGMVEDWKRCCASATVVPPKECPSRKTPLDISATAISEANVWSMCVVRRAFDSS